MGICGGEKVPKEVASWAMDALVSKPFIYMWTGYVMMKLIESVYKFLIVHLRF